MLKFVLILCDLCCDLCCDFFTLPPSCFFKKKNEVKFAKNCSYVDQTGEFFVTARLINTGLSAVMTVDVDKQFVTMTGHRFY